MCFFRIRFVVSGVPGRGPGGVWEGRTGHFTKSVQKCLGAFQGPTLARKTRDNFARSRSRWGSGAIFRNYRAFYALKWVPNLPRDTFGETHDDAISALLAPPGSSKIVPREFQDRQNMEYCKKGPMADRAKQNAGESTGATDFDTHLTKEGEKTKTMRK